MRQYRKHGNNRTDFLALRDWLTEFEPFANSSKTFRGEPVRNAVGISTGRMEPDQYRTFTARAWQINYVVYSYGTPIAWHDKESGWIVSGNNYSPTTAQHLSPIRAALSDIGYAES